MNKNNLKIEILPNYFLNENGTFNKNDALNLSGKIAGVCYDEDGFKHLNQESEEKTLKRINRTLNSGHHSVYDHINITFNLQNIPKILAMVLNNENQYTTSEKSARYTKIVKQKGSIISDIEETLYNKWLNIFEVKIKTKYGECLSDYKIKKLAQENARYLVTVFMPTEMIYTTTLRQINYIVSWILNYIENCDTNDYFQSQLAISMKQFVEELDRLNVLVFDLMNNEKHRKISLFGTDLDKKQDYFGEVYSTIYSATFAELAQAQRHRTIDYQMERNISKEYFIPPILLDDKMLVDEWLQDIAKVSDFVPQGELINIHEVGKYDDFILKCKERLCSEAQLEIMQQERKTLLKYKDALELMNHPLFKDILKYSNGARCTFPDFTCSKDCKFKEGKTLRRII